MQFIGHTNIDFIGLRKYGYMLTCIAILVSILSIGYHYSQTGHIFRWGIDFSGGVQIDVKFAKPIQEEQIRTTLQSLKLEELTIQRVMMSGSEPMFNIRTKAGSDTQAAKTAIANQVIQALQQQIPGNQITVLSQQSVGSSVAGDFISRAAWAVILSWIGIIVYLHIRYEFKFATAAVFALIHDTIITLGALSFFNIEITLVVVAAILTNIGYSSNDTIIIFDRIRENRKLTRRMEFGENVNLSTNQTLSRTMLTVLTVLMVDLSLFFFGGTVIHDFALTLLVGIVTGTFSSIYVASPIILEWINWDKRRAARKATAGRK